MPGVPYFGSGDGHCYQYARCTSRYVSVVHVLRVALQCIICWTNNILFGTFSVLMTPQLTRHVMAGIYSFTPKLNMEDGHRVEMTVNHYQPYIDFDLLLDEAGSNEAGVV